MQKHIVQIAASCLFVAALAASPVASSAAEESPAKATAAPDQATPAKSKKHGISFIGELTAVNTNAMTLSVSNLTLHVTTNTVIKTGSKPAKLSDAVVGQLTSGAYEKNAEGKLEAVTLHLNTKAGKSDTKKSGGKKKKDSAAPNGSE